MKREIILEELPGFETSVKIVKLNIDEGENLEVGDIILSMEGGKCSEDLESELAGKVISLEVEEGEELEKGSLIAVVEVDDLEEVQSMEEAELSPEKETSEDSYKAEVVVLGGGPGGYVAAIRASQNGKSVILIEEDSLGGTCLNRGCIPTKSLVESTKVKDTIEDAAIFGIEEASGRLSMEKVIDRKDSVVRSLVAGLETSMDKHDIKVLAGRGRARDEKSLFVNLEGEDRLVEFENLILAPGSVVSLPPCEGADAEDILTSDDLLDLREIPESLIIIGGRVIAMEFAFIYSKLGSKVTVIQRSDTIFPNFDEDIIELIRDSALEEGINLVEGSDVGSIKTTLDGKKIVVLEQDGEEKMIAAEKLAIATGREPNLAGLDLDKLGVELSDETWGIKVDDKMQTTADNIYAIGDATNLWNLAHVASKHGMIAADNISGKDKKMDYKAIPEAVFTDPEIGLVGMSEKMCKQEGIDYTLGKFPYMANGKALVENETKGFIKVIGDKKTGRIIGAGLIGLAATDLLSVFSNLVANKNTIDEAKDVIYAHPTVSETAFEAILDLDNESIHK